MKQNFIKQKLAFILLALGIQQAITAACCPSGLPLPLPLPGVNINGIAYSPNGTCLAVTDTLNSVVNIYSVTPGVCGVNSLTPLQISILAPLATAFSTDGNCLAIASGNTVAIYTMNGCTPSATPVATINLGIAIPNSISFSPNGCIAVSDLATGNIRIFSFVNCTPSADPTATIVTGTLNSLSSISFSPDGNCLAAGFNTSNLVNIYEFTGCTPNGTSNPINLLIPPLALAYSPNGLCLATAGNLTTSFLRINNCNPIETTSLDISTTALIRGLAFSPDGGCLTIALANSTIQFFPVNGPTVTITSNPNPAIIDAGQSVVLTATASGVNPLNYQWNLNGSPITGATNTTFTTSTAGQYTVTVTDANGCTATSNTITVTVNPGLTVTVTPQSQTIDAGQTIQLIATPSGGTAPYSYVWEQNGTPIPGQTNATLTIPNAQPSDSGTYSVIVTDATGATATDQAQVTVNSGLAVTVTPQSQTIDAGQTIQLTATPSGGTAPYSYVWEQNGTPIPGQTNATLTIPNAQPSDSGTYSVIVTDATGATATDQAQVTVNSGLAVTVTPQSQTVNVEDIIQLTADVIGGSGDNTFQWLKDGMPIAGQTNPTLTIPNAQPTDAGIYSVVVTDSTGSTATAQASVIVNGGLAVIVNPTNVNTVVGDTITIVATPIGGNPPYNFQWLRNNQLIQGQTGATLSIPNAQISDSGVYLVIATDVNGNKGTALAQVNVNPFALTIEPLLANIEPGQTLTFRAILDNPEFATFQWFHNGRILPDQTAQTLTIPNAQPSDSGTYSVRAINNGLTATATATARVETQLIVNVIPSSLNVCQGCSFTLNAEVTGGTAPYTFFWRGPNNFTATGQSITITNATFANSGIYRVIVIDSLGNIAVDTSTVTVNQTSAIARAILNKYCNNIG